MNAGSLFEIATVAIPALATVLVAWLNTRPSRKLTVTKEDRTIVHAEGRSVSEVERLLLVAGNVAAMETKKPDAEEK